MDELSSLESQASGILKEELRREGLECDLAIARIYSNVRTVGVQGDERSYAYPVEIELRKDDRIVWKPEFLTRLSTRIPNEVKGINRVVCVVGPDFAGYISDLVSDLKLPADADIYLDSIKWQAEKAGKFSAEIMKELKHSASIASFYEDPIAALKKLDKAFPLYMRVSRDPHRKVSLENLHRADYELVQKVKMPLSLAGLDGRIKQYLFGISPH